MSAPEPYRERNEGGESPPCRPLNRRPDFVTLGIILIMGTSLISAVSTFFTFDLSVQMLKAQDASFASTPSMLNALATFTFAYVLFFTVLDGVLCWFMAKGKRWARTVTLVLAVGGLLLSVSGLLDVFKFSVLWGLWLSALMIVSFLGVGCLFMPISNLWFLRSTPP